MHNYLIMSQIAINLDTNFPLGRKAMGRNGHYAQVGTAAFLSLHRECSLFFITQYYVLAWLSIHRCEVCKSHMNLMLEILWI